MQALGAWEAQNLDGGGSSEMIIRKDGQLVVYNRPSDGSERRVANGLAIVKKRQ